MKYYFSKLDDERCYPLGAIKACMKDSDIDELEVTEAKRKTGQDYFYCSLYNDIGEKGCCGIQCPGYSSTNHKSGRCRYLGYCYEPTDKKRMIKIKL